MMKRETNRPKPAIKLTSLSHGAGWACKIGPEDLAQVLRHLPTITDPKLLAGRKNSEDAAVYLVADGLAMVQSVDFITPVVNDAYAFGAIAAANALSDIYAMGARPVLALNIVGFPSGTLPISTLEEIVRGGADKAREAGVLVAGGHSIDDGEPKYGMAVSGLVDPARIVTNSGARPGDLLVLTKPLGSGIVATAIDQEVASDKAIEEVVAVMSSLNRDASEAMVEVGVNGCTDVSGFGLLGHLHEMLQASGVAATIWLDRVPVLESVWELARDGRVPEGTHNNHRYLSDRVDWGGIPREEQLVLSDAQTSGGLLIACPADRHPALLGSLAGRRVSAATIGSIEAGIAGHISISTYNTARETLEDR